MYPPSSCLNSPQFGHSIDYAIGPKTKSLLPQVSKGQSSDSLHFRFADPLIALNSTVTFGNGFSTSSPFPSTTTNASNGIVTMNPNNGLIGFDIDSANNGVYYFVTEVEQWYNGQLIGIVRKRCSCLSQFKFYW